MVSLTAKKVEKALLSLKNKEKADFLKKYFKTGKGEYGFGDIFLGITVPEQRTIAKKYRGIALDEVKKLLSSKIHEFRFTALEILVLKYEKAKETEKKKIVSFYLRVRKYINNWDLVDTSARYILGEYYFDKSKDILMRLALSKSVWDRRIAIVSTHAFIARDYFEVTFKIAELLLKDSHDLIHKATGWMLREVGNKDKQALVGFLKAHHRDMPRTMLRYAIEKFPQKERKAFL